MDLAIKKLIGEIMIELKNVSFSINGKDILKDINVKFDKCISVITGPNGAGKSTLAKLIMGLLPVTSGEIWLNGENITNLSISERARKGIAFAFQRPVKFKGLYVKDLIKLSSSGNKSENALAKVGLCARDYLNRELNAELSGGELKRVEIASVIARKAGVTIFDEPEAGIDLWSFNQLINTFKEFQAKNKGVVILISHQQKMIDMADQIILLEDGKLAATGKKEDVEKLLFKGLRNCVNCEVKDE